MAISYGQVETFIDDLKDGLAHFYILCEDTAIKTALFGDQKSDGERVVVRGQAITIPYSTLLVFTACAYKESSCQFLRNDYVVTDSMGFIGYGQVGPYVVYNSSASDRAKKISSKFYCNTLDRYSGVGCPKIVPYSAYFDMTYFSQAYFNLAAQMADLVIKTHPVESMSLGLATNDFIALVKKAYLHGYGHYFSLFTNADDQNIKESIGILQEDFVRITQNGVRKSYTAYKERPYLPIYENYWSGAKQYQSSDSYVVLDPANRIDSIILMVCHFLECAYGKRADLLYAVQRAGQLGLTLLNNSYALGALAEIAKTVYKQYNAAPQAAANADKYAVILKQVAAAYLKALTS